MSDVNASDEKPGDVKAAAEDWADIEARAVVNKIWWDSTDPYDERAKEFAIKSIAARLKNAAAHGYERGRGDMGAEFLKAHETDMRAIREERDSLRAEVDGWKQSESDCNRQYDILLAERDRLAARVAELERACKMVLLGAVVCSEDEHATPDWVVSGHGIRHIRRALAASQGEKHEGDA